LQSILTSESFVTNPGILNLNNLPISILELFLIFKSFSHSVECGRLKHKPCLLVSPSKWRKSLTPSYQRWQEDWGGWKLSTRVFSLFF
jgi:hypothetical protein